VASSTFAKVRRTVRGFVWDFFFGGGVGGVGGLGGGFVLDRRRRAGFPFPLPLVRTYELTAWAAVQFFFASAFLRLPFLVLASLF